MWKQILANRGIAEESLPSKTRKMITDLVEMEGGIQEMKTDLAAEQLAQTRREIQEDIEVLTEEAEKLSKKIYKEVQYLKKNEDGTLGQYTEAELEQLWQQRVSGFNPTSKTKTKSIF